MISSTSLQVGYDPVWSDRLQTMSKRRDFIKGAAGPKAATRREQNNRRVYGGSAQVCETCSIGDMVYIACRLSQAGFGDYWDDVDQYVRNHLVESQLLRRDLIEEIIKTAIEHTLNPEIESGERVIERGLGWCGN